MGLMSTNSLLFYHWRVENKQRDKTQNVKLIFIGIYEKIHTIPKLLFTKTQCTKQCERFINENKFSKKQAYRKAPLVAK